MARLREAGPTPPEAPPTSCGRRWAACVMPGPGGQLTVRAGSGFLHPWRRRRLPQDGCPLLHHRCASTGACEISPWPYPRGNGGPSPTGWRAPPTWPRLNTPLTRVNPAPQTVRLIVRRVKPTPGSQLAPVRQIQLSRLHHRPQGDILELEAGHRRHAEIGERHPGPEVRCRPQPSPSGRFAANAAWLAVQVMAHNLARWTARIALAEPAATTKTIRRRFFSLAGRITRKARRLTLHLPQGWPWKTSSTAPGPIACPATPFLTSTSATGPPTGQLKAPTESRPGRAAIVSSCR